MLVDANCYPIRGVVRKGNARPNDNHGRAAQRECRATGDVLRIARLRGGAPDPSDIRCPGGTTKTELDAAHVF